MAAFAAQSQVGNNGSGGQDLNLFGGTANQRNFSVPFPYKSVVDALSY
jgi:hypothetical protein